MFLGIDNSRARGRPEQPLAKLTFFASYWIDNRTGMDLVFQDHAAASPNPLLLGARMPGAFAQVLVPGQSPSLWSKLFTVQNTLSSNGRGMKRMMWSLSGQFHITICVLYTALPKLEEVGAPRKEVWDVQSAEEILVSPVLLNSQVDMHCTVYPYRACLGHKQLYRNLVSLVLIL